MKTKEEIEDIIDETLEKLGYDCTGDKTADFVDGFVRGYTQCQEDNIEKRYTEVDMRRAMKYASEITNNKMKYMEDYINSLNKQD